MRVSEYTTSAPPPDPFQLFSVIYMLYNNVEKLGGAWRRHYMYLEYSCNKYCNLISHIEVSNQFRDLQVL